MHIRRGCCLHTRSLVHFYRTRNYSQIVCIPQCLRATAKTVIEINTTASRTQLFEWCLTQSNDDRVSLCFKIHYEWDMPSIFLILFIFCYQFLAFSMNSVYHLSFVSCYLILHENSINLVDNNPKKASLRNPDQRENLIYQFK